MMICLTINKRNNKQKHLSGYYQPSSKATAVYWVIYK